MELLIAVDTTQIMKDVNEQVIASMTAVKLDENEVEELTTLMNEGTINLLDQIARDKDIASHMVERFILSQFATEMEKYLQ